MGGKRGTGLGREIHRVSVYFTRQRAGGQVSFSLSGQLRGLSGGVRNGSYLGRDREKRRLPYPTTIPECESGENRFRIADGVLRKPEYGVGKYLEGDRVRLQPLSLLAKGRQCGVLLATATSSRV